MAALKPSSSDLYLTDQDTSMEKEETPDNFPHLQTCAGAEEGLLTFSAVRRLTRPLKEITTVASIANDIRSSHDRSSLVWRNVHSPVRYGEDEAWVPEQDAMHTFKANHGRHILFLCVVFLVIV
jgi:hypothetical protein